MELKHLDRMPKSVPLPSHRHATPSGPWPWMDLESPETNHPLQVTPCGHENCDICPQWLSYPQSHFPNWTPDQVDRCNIAPAVAKRQHNCKIYHVDVGNEEGKFVSSKNSDGFLVTKDTQRELWEWLKISVSMDPKALLLSSQRIITEQAESARTGSFHRKYVGRCTSGTRSKVSR